MSVPVFVVKSYEGEILTASATRPAFEGDIEVVASFSPIRAFFTREEAEEACDVQEGQYIVRGHLVLDE